MKNLDYSGNIEEDLQRKDKSLINTNINNFNKDTILKNEFIKNESIVLLTCICIILANIQDLIVTLGYFLALGLPLTYIVKKITEMDVENAIEDYHTKYNIKQLIEALQQEDICIKEQDLKTAPIKIIDTTEVTKNKDYIGKEKYRRTILIYLLDQKQRLQILRQQMINEKTGPLLLYEEEDIKEEQISPQILMMLKNKKPDHDVNPI